jgi:hypothetical protein
MPYQCIAKRLISDDHMISVDKLRVYMLKAGKIFEGSTSEVCERISKQIDSDLAIPYDKKMQESDRDAKRN